MDITRLDKILSETTALFCKDRPAPRRDPKPAHAGVGALDLNVATLPSEREVKPSLEKVDFELLIVAVDRSIAERHRAELLHLLMAYPRPKRLKAGLSYVGLATDLGDRVRALRLMAMGKAIALWDLITPARLRLKGDAALRLAELGIIMTTGFDSVGREEARTRERVAPARPRVAAGTRAARA